MPIEGFPGADDDDDLVHLSMTESTKQDLLRLGIDPDLFAGDDAVTVRPDLDAREMTVICERGAFSLWFDDDVIGKCDRCASTVHHRPHVPLGAILICIDCYQKELKAKGLPDPMEEIRRQQQKKRRFGKN